MSARDYAEEAASVMRGLDTARVIARLLETAPDDVDPRLVRAAAEHIHGLLDVAHNDVDVLRAAMGGM